MLSEYGENREFIGEEGENDIICPPEIAALAGALLQSHQLSYLSDPWGEKKAPDHTGSAFQAYMVKSIEEGQ